MGLCETRLMDSCKRWDVAAGDKIQAKNQNEDFEATIVFLSQVQLFKLLPKDQHPLLANACISQSFKKDDVVIKQGDMGDAFYIIRSGEASVTVTNDEGAAKVATLKKGDYFGENALLRDEPRTATIVAATPMSTFKITRQQFQELGLNNKLQFVTRKAVGGGGGGERQIEIKPPSPKNEAERTLITEALGKNDNLQTMATLDDESMKQMIDCAWKETVEAGSVIIEEGDLNADYFYVVQSGGFEVLLAPDGGAQSAEGKLKEGKTVGSLGPGDSFGELALLYLVPRAATVKAKVKSAVWVIDRMSFKSILLKKSNDKVSEYMRYLDSVEILAPLLADEKAALADALVEMRFEKGEAILTQGEQGNTFYILFEGEVSVVINGEEKAKLAANAREKTAQYFGEKALMKNEPRAATVRVVSQHAKVLVLDRDSFDMLLGSLEDVIKANNSRLGRTSTPGGGDAAASSSSAAKNRKQKALKKQMDANAPAPKERVSRSDLTKIGLLGCGGFGAVDLVEHKPSGNSYALKALSKGYIVKTGMQQSVINEKNILLMTNSVFVIKLFATYNSSQTLLFLLEAALGGELYATYNKKGLHGSEKHAKFYIAGTIFAFEHLHQRHIIYRDLKPENLLMNEQGHLKLTDMGLAKFVIGRTFTTCGTPDYFAPELIASAGHTNAVDWWTLGILTYELMSGHPPFEAPNPMQIYAKVVKGIGRIKFPAKCQGPVGELIRDLLKKEPSERLPMKPDGTKLIRGHKWYASFDWKKMEDLTLEPPYKPIVKSKTDIANFNARKEDMPKQIPYKDDGTGWDKDFES